jgi:hypothetical protein
MGDAAFILVPRKNELHTVILDAEDYERLKGFRWFVDNCGCGPNSRKYYAVRSGPGRGKKTYMHREITGALPGVVVDHKDGNGLNNRRSNFLLTTQSDNARRQNKAIRRRAA